MQLFVPAVVAILTLPTPGAKLEKRPHAAPKHLLDAFDKHACPEGMVRVGAFCIDRVEASLVEVLPDGSERPFPPTERPSPGARVRAIAELGRIPQGYVSGEDAKRACTASKKRLCKPAEWKQACMGPKKNIWPYGMQHQAKRCNDYGQSPMQRLHPDLTDRPHDRWKWGAFDNMMDPRLNKLPLTVARAGEHPGCMSDYGVLDMVGNLHEWVDDPNGTFQGGYYLDTRLNRDGCYYETTAHDVRHADYSTGFRCCADAD